MGHARPAYIVLTFRRLLMLALCAALAVGAGVAFVQSYRLQLLATYVERKTDGVQLQDELDNALEAQYTDRMVAERALAAAAPVSDSIMARRVSAAAFDRADMFDRAATGLTILLVLFVAITITVWNRKPRRKRDDMESKLDALAISKQRERSERLRETDTHR